MCDAAAAGMGVGLIRLKLGAPWLENGTMERWECAAFSQWLRKSIGTAE